MPGVTSSELTGDFLNRLRSFVARRSPPGVDADDIVQDVLARLWAQVERPKGRKLQGWLFTAARNAVVDAYRRQKPQVDLESVQEMVMSLELPSAWSELSQCVQPLLSSLSAADQELLQAIDMRGQSQTELARQLGVPASTIKARVQRARGRLLEQVKACCWLAQDHRGRLLDFRPRPGFCGC